MKTVINVRHPGIVAINGQNVLSQIVGANRDEIDPLCQMRQHKYH